MTPNNSHISGERGKITLAPRAAAVLYNLLAARSDRRPFLLPANICPIVPITFFKAGMPFEFVDISPGSLGMGLDQAAERIRTGKYGGLLYAHTYGDPATPLDFFAEVKRDGSILLIDDRCLCIPDLEPDPLNPADVLLYSTGHAKIVDLDHGGYAFIQAGLEYRPKNLPYNADAMTAVKKAYETSIAQRQPFVYQDSNWLITDEQGLDWTSYRSRIEAELPGSLAHRRALNEIYASQLPSEIQLESKFQLWRFNLRVSDQQRILNALFANQLFASAHYASLAGIMSPGDCPNSARLAESVINLFNDHHYTPEMAGQTCDLINQNL